MSGLAGCYEGGTSTICRAWVLTRKDGQVFGFTDHDDALTVDGVACVASSGLDAGALDQATGLSVDNAEASGALSHDGVTREDIEAGRWDAAAIVSYLVDWSNPSAFEVTFRGNLGEITWGGGAFSVELRGLSDALNKPRGRIYQRRCDADLGDGRCGVALSDPAWSAEAVLTRVEGARVLLVGTLPGHAAGLFAQGRLEVLDGAAAGQEGKVKLDRAEAGGRRLELWAPLRGELRVGDRVRLSAGCDKRAETCRAVFGNFLNFRGFPHIPGDDWLMAYPTQDGVHDGGRR